MIRIKDSEDNVKITDNLPVSEWEKFRKLRLRALQKEPQAFLVTYKETLSRPPEKWQNTLQKVVDGESWLVFAKVADKLVGMIGAFQSEENKKENEATIYGVYVDREMRGKGIGAKLMDGILERLKKKNISKVSLSVNKDQISAIKLYEKFEFRVAGEENLILGDGKMHTELVMEKISIIE